MSSVLLVDDEPGISRAFQSFLEREGYAVVVVASGEEAQVTLEQQHFDVLVSDLLLPRMTGLELAALAKQALPRLGVVIITGEPSRSTAEEAETLGVTYLVKPVRRAKLLEAVSQALITADTPT